MKYEEPKAVVLLQDSVITTSPTGEETQATQSTEWYPPVRP